MSYLKELKKFVMLHVLTQDNNQKMLFKILNNIL